MRDKLFPLILLVLSGWLFTATVQGAANLTSVDTLAASTPSSPVALPDIIVTPTIDRLAAPPTVENPTQADEGAQLFWLHCQPCHGDAGQGLTDEWRQQYPPEDQDCWMSGCHGKRPYENGFTLPTAVPPLIGGGSLQRFETIGQVYGFMSSAMPFQDPGHLSEEEYLAITAFLARAHYVWDGTKLDTENVNRFRLRPAPTAETPEATPLLATPSQDTDTSEQPNHQPFNTFMIGIAAGVIGSMVIIVLLIKRRMQQ